MDAYEQEQMVHDFIEAQGIGVAFPQTNLDTMVALVNFGRTVLEDAEKAEDILYHVYHEIIDYPGQPLSEKLQKAIREYSGDDVKEVQNATTAS